MPALSPPSLPSLDEFKHGIENLRLIRTAVTIQSRCVVAWLSIYLWDLMSTLPEEYVHIWKKRISWLKVLFLIGRYGTLISQTLSIWMVKADISPDLCERIFWFQPALTVLLSCICSGILCLRLYALYERKKRIKIGLISVVMVQLIFMIGGCVHFRPLILKPIARSLIGFHGCIPIAQPRERGRFDPILLFWLAPLAADTIILALTLTRILTLVEPVKLDHEQLQPPTKLRVALLYKTLARYGVLYYLAVQAVNIATLVAYAQSNGAVKTSKSPGNAAFTMVFCSRLVLSLFTVNSASPCRSLSPLHSNNQSTYPPTSLLSSELDTAPSSTACESDATKRESLSFSLSPQKGRQSLVLSPRLSQSLPRHLRDRPTSLPMLLTPPSSPCKIILTPPPSPHTLDFSPPPSNPLSFDQDRRGSTSSIVSTSTTRPESQEVTEVPFSFGGTSPIALDFNSLNRGERRDIASGRSREGRFSLATINRLSRVLF